MEPTLPPSERREPLITAQELAALLNIPPGRLLRWTRNGDVPSVTEAYHPWSMGETDLV